MTQIVNTTELFLVEKYTVMSSDIDRRTNTHFSHSVYGTDTGEDHKRVQLSLLLRKALRTTIKLFKAMIGMEHVYLNQVKTNYQFLLMSHDNKYILSG